MLVSAREWLTVKIDKRLGDAKPQLGIESEIVVPGENVACR